MPATPDEAIAWIEQAVELIGPRFHPDTPFNDYVGVRSRDGSGFLDLSEAEVAALDAARAAATGLLGQRAYDIAYRSAVNYLERIDTEWTTWARPVTQPSARWWLVEPPVEDNQPPSVAFQDAVGLWWEYDPATGRLHQTPWLETHFYYPDERAAYGFTKLSAGEARGLIARGMGRRDSPQLRAAREADDLALDPEEILGSAA
ncbi:MAG: hypothetical protein JO342_02825 [Solirubrobacterales bacterium]|nr:hypothetical protein [Solirubrobacterales bacterium]